MEKVEIQSAIEMIGNNLARYRKQIEGLDKYDMKRIRKQKSIRKLEADIQELTQIQEAGIKPGCEYGGTTQAVLIKYNIRTIY